VRQEGIIGRDVRVDRGDRLQVDAETRLQVQSTFADAGRVSVLVSVLSISSGCGACFDSLEIPYENCFFEVGLSPVEFG
jgi:hypothetical protein